MYNIMRQLVFIFLLIFALVRVGESHPTPSLTYTNPTSTGLQLATLAPADGTTPLIRKINESVHPPVGTVDILRTGSLTAQTTIPTGTLIATADTTETGLQNNTRANKTSIELEADKRVVEPEFFYSGSGLHITCRQRTLSLEIIADFLDNPETKPNKPEYGIRQSDWNKELEMYRGESDHGVRNKCINRKAWCYYCRCDPESGEIITAKFPAGSSERKRYGPGSDRECTKASWPRLCMILYGCSCFAELTQPTPTEAHSTDTLLDFQRAIDRIPAIVRLAQANRDWSWEVDGTRAQHPGHRLGFSQDYMAILSQDDTPNPESQDPGAPLPLYGPNGELLTGDYELQDPDVWVYNQMRYGRGGFDDSFGQGSSSGGGGFFDA